MNKTGIKLLKLGLRAKLLILVLFTLIATISLTTIVSYEQSKKALQDQSYNQLVAMREIAKNRLIDYMNRSQNFTRRLATDRLIEGLFLAYEGAFYGGAFTSGVDQEIYTDQYTDLVSIYGSRTKEFIDDYNFLNVLLVTISGQIVFSQIEDKSGDLLGRSLTAGELSDSKLAKCYNEAMAASQTTVVFSEYEFNPITKNVTAFLCAKQFAEFDHLSEGIKKGDSMGVVVSQLSNTFIATLLNQREGMGETGQSYIVGDDHLIRSDFFVEKEIFNVKKIFQEKKEIKTEAIELALAGKSGFITQIDPLGHEVIAAYAPIELFDHKWALLSEKQTQEVYAPVRAMLRAVVQVGVLSFVAIFVISYLMTTSITSPLIKANTVLRKMVTKLSSSSTALKTDAQTLKQGATSQASEIQNTANTLTEITQVSHTSVEYVKQSSAQSAEAESVTLEGKIAISQMISAIENVNTSNTQVMNQIQDSNRKMIEIMELINEISNKTAVINDIAFQTKLLSFNASVEAARAGEHGKGFAVVAEEVGSLAQVSGKSANEISSLLNEGIPQIEAIIKETQNEVEKLLSQSTEKIENSVEVANRCSETFERILGQVQGVGKMMAGVEASAQEQATGIEMINTAILNIDQATQETTKVAEKSALSADSLSQQSADLNKIVNDLEAQLFGGQKHTSTHSINNGPSAGGKLLGNIKKAVPFKKSA